MKLLKNLAAAFSLYSRIPMPTWRWEEDDMKHMLVFLPWVGAVIGALVYACTRIFDVVDVPMVAKVALISAIPLLVTGGFHLDGFMDVQDALRSWKPKEEKLAILSDPHVGAFAVIATLTFGLIWCAALAVALDDATGTATTLFALSFFETRALCATTALKLPRARKDGMLHRETQGAGNADFIALAVEATLGAAAILAVDPIRGAVVLAGAALMTARYRRICLREFGGVTGDTAGYYVVTGEGFALALAALLSLWR